MANQYRYGRSKEQKVAQSLRNKGASVKTSPRSRTGVDLKAKFPTGTKWDVQVKSSRTNRPPTVAPRDLNRLKQIARRDNATPIIANVTPKGIIYKSASGKTLKPLKK